MKPNPLFLLPLTLLTACALLSPERPAADGLRGAYATMQQAIAANGDDFAAEEMQAARQRYEQAYAAMKTDPARAQRLAERSQLMAELALAKAQAVLAAQQRAAAKKEMDSIEQLALSGGMRR